MPAHLWQLLEYRPRPWAWYQLHTSKARFNAYATSRRAGKTTAIIHEIIDALLAPPREDDPTHLRNAFGKITKRKPNVVGVVSDKYDRTDLVIMPFITLLNELLGPDSYSLNKNSHVLIMNEDYGSHELRWFSAEDPRAGQGYGFSTVFIDEAQNVSDEFWINLRPAIGDRMGRVFATGTPDPVPTSTWFKGLFLNGQDEDNPDYYSYSIACTMNTWMPEDEIRDAMQQLSESEFKMKYLGQWVDDEGVVFRNPERCFSGGWEQPDPTSVYSIGLDLAKHVDFTVAYVIDTKRKAIVQRERFNNLDYVKVVERVKDLYTRYHARRVRMDSTGVGVPVADMLRHNGVRVIDFTFTNKSKGELVSTLAREIEHQRIVFPKEDAQLLRELRAFTRQVTKAGNVQFTAPVNSNDDCVMAAGLACLEARTTGLTSMTSYI